MLYIFNSGFRDNYVVNALNTLCLPFGSANAYSYGVSSAANLGNVAATVADNIVALPANTDVLVVFIDRFRADQKYVYHPLRSGRFLSAQVDDGRLNVRVKLQDFWTPVDPKEFSDAVTTQLVPLGAPAFKDSVDNRRDGQYAISADVDLRSAIKSTNDWRALVDRLAATTALGATVEQPVVFARAELFDDAERTNALLPNGVGDDQDRFRIARGRKYVFATSYVSPVQNLDKSVTAEMHVALGDDLRATSDTNHPLNAAARRAEVVFATKQLMEDNKSRISLSFAPPVGVKKFYAPKIDLPLEVIETGTSWVALVALVLLYCAGTVFAGLDYSKAVTAGPVSAKIAGSIAQVGAIVGMLRVFGKKYA
jgi:hypothetical protein